MSPNREGLDPYQEKKKQESRKKIIDCLDNVTSARTTYIMKKTNLFRTTILSHLKEMEEEKIVFKDGYEYYTQAGLLLKKYEEEKNQFKRSRRPLNFNPYMISGFWNKKNIKTSLDYLDLHEKYEYEASYGKVTSQKKILIDAEHFLWSAGIKSSIWMNGLTQEALDLEVFEAIKNLIETLIKKALIETPENIRISLNLDFSIPSAIELNTKDFKNFPVEWYQTAKIEEYKEASRLMVRDIKNPVIPGLRKRLFNRYYRLVFGDIFQEK